MIYSLIFSVFTWASYSYPTEIKHWRLLRVESLKAENGWLNLVGLHWLREGKQTLGGKTADIRLADKMPELGSLTFDHETVTFEATQGLVTANQQPVNHIKLYPSEKPVVLSYKSFRFFVIKRGAKYALRVRDLHAKSVKNFKGIKYFPIDSAYKITGKFTPVLGKKIPIADVTGQTNLQECPGTINFSFKGKEYSLDALKEGDKLFIIFADATNGHTTYGAGRFLYADWPDEAQSVILDFNKAINPPCAFTGFATCPLPPAQNTLSIALPAGEKTFGHH